MKKILVINGSYRVGGITDQAVEVATKVILDADVKVEIVLLRDTPIEFCLNCRKCTQVPGEAPGRCVFNDGMEKLVTSIEQADGYIFACPTNFATVTAIYKRFLERLLVYAYWPWGEHAPRHRKAHVLKKKALLLSSCAAPGILGRWAYDTHKQLKMTATTVGATSVGAIFTGLMSIDPRQKLPSGTQLKVQKLAGKLLV